MAAERDLELLDDYLANRLDENSRSAFEQKLNSDPELKNEFNLQQQFVNGIKKARVAELKAMMNNIPIPAGPSGGAAIAAKVVLWTVVVGVIGTGLYLYLNPSSEVGKTPVIEQEKTDQKPTVTDNPENKKKEDSPVVSPEKASSEQKPEESPKAIKKNKVKEKATSKDPKIEVFDPTKEVENEPKDESPDAALPKINPLEDMAVEIDSDNKKYTFHYQFKQGKLFLYGPFEKNIYEIMEFFGDDNKRTLFLFYKDDYYLLKDGTQKLKALSPIQDTILIKKLKEYRN